MVNKASGFGDYVCKARNDLGELERTIHLQAGEKPEPPGKLELNGVNSSMFDLDVGASMISVKNDKWRVTGFRLEYMPNEQFEANGRKWVKASVYEIGFDPRKLNLVTDPTTETND